MTNNEENKKSKSSVILAVMGVIILFVIMEIFIGGIKKISNKETVKPINAETKKQSTVQAKTYQVGSIVKAGNWEIIVEGSEDKKTLEGIWGNKTTENNYIIVKLKIKNISNEPCSLLTTKTEQTENSFGIYSRSILELYDGKSTYIADYNLEDYANNEFDTFLNKVNPNTTITYNAVFETDLPTTQKEYKLKLNNNDKILLRIK